jgi:predicted Zn-ribbon and HTH transcriptional regulator
MTLKPEFKYLEHGVTPAECKDCKRVYYWVVVPKQCPRCKGELRVISED